MQKVNIMFFCPQACALNKEEKAFEQEPQDIGKEKETMDDNYMVDSGHLELPLEIQVSNNVNLSFIICFALFLVIFILPTH